MALTLVQKKAENDLADQKHQAKLVVRKLNLNSVPRASIESGNYVIQYVIPESYGARLIRNLATSLILPSVISAYAIKVFQGSWPSHTLKILRRIFRQTMALNACNQEFGLMLLCNLVSRSKRHFLMAF